MGYLHSTLCSQQVKDLNPCHPDRTSDNETKRITPICYVDPMYQAPRLIN